MGRGVAVGAGGQVLRPSGGGCADCSIKLPQHRNDKCDVEKRTCPDSCTVYHVSIHARLSSPRL